jgi:hypothetical protein
MPDRGDVDWEKTDKTKFLLYGGLFTIGVDFILYPLELLKTRVQVEAKSRATLFEASVSAYKGVLQQNGVRGLWGGFPLYTIGGLPSQGAYFYGYQWAVSKCTAWNLARSEDTRVPLFMIDMAAGFFADVVAAPLWTPTEVVASRLQIQGPGVVKYDGALHAFRHILATEGVAGFFRGISVSILAFGPASALWWAMYQACNRNLTAAYHSPKNDIFLDLDNTNSSSISQSNSKSNSSSISQSNSKSENFENISKSETESGHVWIEALSGLVAGTVSSVVTNPLDIAKTRLQTQHVLLQDFDLIDISDTKKGENKTGIISKVVYSLHKQNALLKAPLRMTASAASAAAAHLKKPGKIISSSSSSSSSTTTTTVVQSTSIHTLPSSPLIPLSSSNSHSLSLPSIGGGGVPFRASIAADMTAVEIAAVATRERVEAAARDEARRAAARGTMAPHGGGGSSGGISGHSIINQTQSQTVKASSTSLPKVLVKDVSKGRLLKSASQTQTRKRNSNSITSHTSHSTVHKVRFQTGLFSVLSDIYRRDGARALLRGLLPRMLMQGPASAATFVCFEQVKRLSKIPNSKEIE